MITDSIGNLVGSFAEEAMAPDIPKTREIFRRGAAALYGQLPYKMDKKLRELGALSSRTPQQERQYQRLLAKQERIKYASPVAAALRGAQEFLPQFEAFEIGRLAENAPKLAQIDIDLANRFGAPLAQAQESGLRATAPEFFDLREMLAQEIMNPGSTQMSKGVQPFLAAKFREKMRGAQAFRGIMDSPLGSEAESLALAELDASQRNLQLANALNLQQSFRMFGGSNPPTLREFGFPLGGTLGTGSYQAPSLSDAISMASARAGLNFARRQGYAQQRGGAIGDITTAILSAAAGGVGGAMGVGGMGGTNVAGENITGGAGFSNAFFGSLGIPTNFGAGTGTANYTNPPDAWFGRYLSN